MEKQLIEKTKKAIKESKLSEDTKIQLLSLMDFINYPEVKERVLKILELEKKVSDLELRYLKEMNKRFRDSDIFGYEKESTVIPNNTRKQMEPETPPQPVTSPNTQDDQRAVNNTPIQINTQQNPPQNNQVNTPPTVQPNVSAV